MQENYAWEYIAERAVKEAEHIISTGATVRACANYFGISKSTVHKDVSERLKDVDAALYTGVRQVLDKNLSERHIRGGLATRDKYRAKCVCSLKEGCACGGDTCGKDDACANCAKGEYACADTALSRSEQKS